MTDNQLLNPWAVDSSGKIISIDHAQKGQSYTCPKCQEPLSFCKSGTGPHARRNHFKHKADTECKGYVTPHETESYIHKTAKEGIYSILKSFIETNLEFPISWACPNCRQAFSGNLINNAKCIEMEKTLDEARCDVALTDKDGKVIAAIEIVYTHDVEENVLSFYEANNITLVRIKFNSVEELNDLEQKLHNPDSVNVCLNVQCKACQSSHLQRQIIPLFNQENKVAAVGVAIFNPFDVQQQSIWGLPFTEQDGQNAVAFVRQNWPDIRCHLQVTQQSGKFLAKLVAPQQRVIQPLYRSRSPRIDLYDQRLDNGTRRYSRTSNSRYKSTSAKSSSGSRKTYGKRKK